MVELGIGRRLASGVSLPWSAFVAVFLYFTVVTACVIGGADFTPPVMAVAYLLPASLYLGILASRAVHALGSVDIHFHRTPHAVLR